MKTATIRYNNAKAQPRIPYPNAATKKELFAKLIDLLMVGALGAAMAALLLFFLVLA